MLFRGWELWGWALAEPPIWSSGKPEVLGYHALGHHQGHTLGAWGGDEIPLIWSHPAAEMQGVQCLQGFPKEEGPWGLAARTWFPESGGPWATIPLPTGWKSPHSGLHLGLVFCPERLEVL